VNAKNVFERKSEKKGGCLEKYPQQRNFEVVDRSILQSLDFRLLSVKQRTARAQVRIRTSRSSDMSLSKYRY